MKKTFTIFSIFILMISGFSFAGESGVVSPGRFPEVGKASPIVKSNFFVVEALVKNRTAHVQLPLDTPDNGIALVLGEPNVKAIGADQQTLEPLSFRDEEMRRVNLPATNTRFNLGKLSAGTQSITLHDIKNARYVRMVISQPESPLEMRVQVKPLAARCGENVTVTAQIKDEQLHQEAHITADLPDGKSITLNDDGQNGDMAAGDGIYSGAFTAPDVTGCQGVNIRFTAKGKRYNGNEFLRNSINTVMVTHPQGRIQKDSIAVNPNQIVVPLSASRGNYRVEIIFGYNGTSLAYSRENVTQKGNPVDVRMTLPGEARAANRAVIRLLNKDTLGLDDEFEISLIPTQAPPDFQAISDRTPQMPDSKRQAAEKIKSQEENDSHNHQ